MQTLDKHNFHQIYYKTRNEIYRDFYKPCLESSIKYDRITGYFGSSVFLVIKDALKDFVQNNGKIRIVCSPIITDEDYDAIISGYFKSLDSSSNKFNEVIDEMSKQYPKTTTLLSNLISLGILEIKMAVFGDNPLAFKLLHDKVGLFHDVNGNTVSFGGSINETYKGVSEFGNSEVFEVNTSWGDASEIKRVSIYKERFNNIWRGDEKGIHTFEIPKVTKDKFRALSNDKNVRELIDEVTIELGHIDEKSPRIDIQYSDLVLGEVAKIGVLHCSSLNDVVIELVDDHKILVLDNDKHTIQAISYGNQKIVLKSNYTNQTLDEREITVIRWAAEPGLNRRKIRNYQETILDNWVKNNRVGIFEMATGSGKTFTAFCAIRDAIYLHDQIPIIIVPRSILFEQWKEEIEKVFGDDVFLYQYGNGNDSTTNLKIASSITGKRKIILSTIQTASNNNFINLLCQGNHLLLVIDEVHNSGSEKYSNLLTINVGSKIGLSATPKRYRDSIGTKKIFDFFGKVIDYPYSLENAIRDKSLCNYLYYPQKVELDLIEGVEYQEL
ncbi:MAG: DEAD/DEAH box helicase family protein, partial [Bacilli bacterium]